MEGSRSSRARARNTLLRAAPTPQPPSHAAALSRVSMPTSHFYGFCFVLCDLCCAYFRLWEEDWPPNTPFFQCFLRSCHWTSIIIFAGSVSKGSNLVPIRGRGRGFGLRPQERRGHVRVRPLCHSPPPSGGGHRVFASRSHSSSSPVAASSSHHRPSVHGHARYLSTPLPPPKAYSTG